MEDLAPILSGLSVWGRNDDGLPALRERLAEQGIRFESAADVARWEAAQFYFTLLAASGQTVFTFPETMDGIEKIPSPFIERMGLLLKPGVNDTISSVEEFRRSTLRTTHTDDDAVLIDARRRFAIETMPPFTMAGLRFLLAGGALYNNLDAAEMQWDDVEHKTFNKVPEVVDGILNQGFI